MIKEELIRKNDDATTDISIIYENGTHVFQKINSHGQELLYSDNRGFWCQSTYNLNGLKTSYRNSERLYYELVYDEHGNCLTPLLDLKK